MAEQAKTFEGWSCARYFDFVAVNDKNTMVKWKLCPGQKHLSNGMNTTSNLSKHLQRHHAKTKAVAKAKESRTQGQSDDRVCFSSPPKQPKLDFEQQVKKADDGQACSIVHTRGNAAGNAKLTHYWSTIIGITSK